MTAPAEQLDLCFDAMVDGIATANRSATRWERDVIDQAVLAFAQTGKPFSANNFRDLLPDITSRKLIGARVAALSQRRPAPYVKVGEVISTDVGTHHKKIGLYQQPSEETTA